MKTATTRTRTKTKKRKPEFKNETDEFSFILRPATYGIGVFATHKIAKGAHLRLFGSEAEERWVEIPREEKDVPELFRIYCVHRPNGITLAPADFGRMHVGWYMNHSYTPTAAHQDLVWYALRDIEEGEEITADYNTLGEPDYKKDPFYIQ